MKNAAYISGEDSTPYLMDKEIKGQGCERLCHKLVVEMGIKVKCPDLYRRPLLLPQGLVAQGQMVTVCPARSHIPEPSPLETCLSATFTPSAQSLEVEDGENLRSVSHIRKVRSREARCLAQGHRAE